MTLTAEDYAADTIGRELGRAFAPHVLAQRRYGYAVQGLLACVSREADPGWTQTGHRDERAAWTAKYVAHHARMLGLVEPWPLVPSVRASWRT